MLLRLCLCYSVVASLIVFGDCVAVMCYDWFVGVLLVNATLVFVVWLLCCGLDWFVCGAWLFVICLF